MNWILDLKYYEIGIYIFIDSKKIEHLNEGTGKLWAGHNTAKLWPACRSIQDLFTSVENVGALLPTGSA